MPGEVHYQGRRLRGSIPNDESRLGPDVVLDAGKKVTGIAMQCR